MGGCQIRDDRIKANSFTTSQIKQIKQVFDHYSSVEDGVSDSFIGPQGFESIFPENKVLAKQLYNWIVFKSYKGILDFETLIIALEILMVDPTRYLSYGQSKDFQIFEKREIIGMVSFENKQFKNNIYDQEFINRQDISYSQALTFFKEIIYMFFDDRTLEEYLINQDDIATKLLTNGLFFNQSSMEFSNFYFSIIPPCSRINNIVLNYFQYQFFGNQESRPRIPTIIGESLIFDLSMVALFALTNPQFSERRYFSKLFSTETEGFNISDLGKSLSQFTQGPTLILIRHCQQFQEVDQYAISKSKISQRKGKNHFAFGIYNSTRFYDAGVSGDDGSYIFSLIPRYKIYNTKRGAAGFNNVNVNKRNKGSGKIGIGIGGTSNERKRIWIDENIQTGSYITPEDSTFQKGHILDPHITKLNIDLIEVWGLSDDYLQKQPMTPVDFENFLDKRESEQKMSYQPDSPPKSPRQYIKEENVSCLLNVDYENEQDDVARLFSERIREKQSLAPPPPPHQQEEYEQDHYIIEKQNRDIYEMNQKYIPSNSYVPPQNRELTPETPSRKTGGFGSQTNYRDQYGFQKNNFD